MNSLSEEQRAMFMNVDLRAVLLGGSEPEAAQPPATTPTTAMTYDTDWFNRKPGSATNVEVRVLGTLLAVRHDDWLKTAKDGETRMRELGELWTPLPDVSAFNSQGGILSFLHSVLNNKVQSDGGDGTIETIAASSGWDVNITAASIYRYFRQLLLPKKSRLKGPSREGGKSHSAQYISALPSIMFLLQAELRPIHRAVERHRVVVTQDVKMTHAEIADQVEVERAESKQAISNLKSKFEAELKAKDDRSLG